MELLYTCADMIRSMEGKPFNAKAFNDRIQGKWRALSTEQFLQAVHDVMLGLCSLGMAKGDRVGIYMNPSSAWTIADIAVMLGGGVSVPLFANISEDNFVYQVKETEMSLLFIEGEEQWSLFRKYDHLIGRAIAIDRVPPDFVYMDKVIAWDDLVKRGKLLNHSQPDLYRKLVEALQPADLAAIIYTSGSTGLPKGVEVTHGNLTCVLNFAKFHWDVRKDRYLSVLPLAHVFGHCINLWVITWGASIYYSNDYKNLGAICREVRPTAIVVVPRLLEKVYARMTEQIHNAHGLKKTMGEWALKIAKGEVATRSSILADLLVFRKMRHALGGKIRIVISGGAALNPMLQQFFDAVGIPIYEGWGLTEACPVCVNVPGEKKVGSVGRPLHDQTLKITPEGEILVKGTLVMRGYYKQPKLTASTVDADGWLHTGDRGVIDEEGFLTISGRIKELYKTSTGEYVAPVPIEQALGRSPLVDMSMVIAEGRKFASCLLFANLETVAKLKVERNQTDMSDEEFLHSEYIRSEMDRFISDINKHLNHWEQVHAYRFILEPLTVQGGELTPSMKIRRDVVAQKYKRMIDEIYHKDTE